MKGHVDPQVTPYTVLGSFRTDIWAHPKRDPVPTPATSPKTRAADRAEEVDEAVERLREVRPRGKVENDDGNKIEEEWVEVGREREGDGGEDGDGKGKKGRGWCLVGMRERDILDGNDDGGSFGKAGWRKWLQRIGRSKEVRMKGCLQSGGETRTAISTWNESQASWTTSGKDVPSGSLDPPELFAVSLIGETLSSNRTSLTSSSTTKENNTRPDGSRTFSATKRFGGDSAPGGAKTPLNGITPLTTTGVASPTSGASSAFGLGSGAFASFGSSAKTPKTPGAAIESSNKDPARESTGPDIKPRASASSLTSKSSGAAASEHPLRYTWIVWYRPPTSKFQDYEKSTVPLAHFSSVETFWTVYTHLKRPSSLPSVSDYHLFRKGIRPVWEDEENKRGGKWIVRLKKGVADRYWEDLLLAIVGDQFAEAGEEVCGAVLSVRSGEDVLSVWTRIDGGRNIKIRETIKRVLAFPPDTNIVWKSHDDSIAQRSAIDQARQEKGVAGGGGGGGGTINQGKRRQTMSEDPALEKSKG
ncbi:MAG: hypothetical protein LQ338_007013 [Usnochroma carphineum]|nr:MAG: hypothetical protein LQ338_007013 [Usnochroma carphineum]